RVAELERREIERVVWRDPVGEQCAEDADEGDQRGTDRDRRMAKAVPRVTVEQAPQRARSRSSVDARGGAHSAFTETHLKVMKLSARWTSSTVFFAPQASACWCSGMWPMSSWWILN